MFNTAITLTCDSFCVVLSLLISLVLFNAYLYIKYIHISKFHILFFLLHLFTINFKNIDIIRFLLLLKSIFVEQIKTLPSYKNSRIIISSGAYNINHIAEVLNVECIPKRVACTDREAYENIIINK